jgi:predicted metal-dependent TIM-barrel fold hydrolase
MAQLELGRILPQHGKSIGIHTPRSNKSHITSTTLDILNQFHDISSLLVIDHCTIDSIGAVLNAGFWAGVTVSPPKTSWDELKRIVAMNSHQIDHIMCNTDSGSVFFEDVVQFSHSDNMSEAVRTKLFYNNAAQFFTIYRSNVQKLFNPLMNRQIISL